ncbi:uncharacterized protein PHACADRAFT_184047 [Phanerochaete carnosa HHB-10118-sp]|uniref:Uncharacterized protein n=1 Tax=Phanerochaete carnosa (strain HHB-10118-sp) TaxID=650164 RepID=K5VUL3_PHACS|nr:uncharacterized protein PHACADRAFT_184047 [Phanerochaete carnosa HHB-10118-sp]EKM55228.1 hypothetical protein PHACADRAFT_184047 [Phanerochaete carnosa HHB-10118-sp]
MPRRYSYVTLTQNMCSWDAWNAVGNCSSNDEQDFNGSFAPGVIPPVDIPEFYYTPIDGTWNVTAAFGAALSAESSSSATNFAATSVTSSLSSATSTSVSSTESTTSADSSSATDSLPPHTPTTAPSSAEIASSSIASSTSVPPISSPSLSVDGNGINGTPPAISSQSVTSSVSPSFASPPPPAANDSKPPPKHSSVGPIVGGVIGGIAGLAMIAILAIYLLRRNRRCQEGSSAVKVLSLGPDTMRFHILQDPEDSSTFLRYDWPTAGEHTDSGAFSSTKGSEGTVRLVPNRLVLL